MARITIEDLPITVLTPEELEQILGAGKRSFRPSFENFESREMYAANLSGALAPGLMSMANAARGAALLQTVAPPNQAQFQGMGAAVQTHPLMNTRLAQQKVGGVNPLLAPSQSEADRVLKANYEQWTKTFLRDGGNNTLRVARPDGNTAYLGVKEDTVSEGMAYGMLLSAYNNDKPTFDKLWAFVQSRIPQNGNGLMPWHIAPDGSTMDIHAATDADEDMAMALIVADKKWGGYTADAKALIGNIMEHEVEKGTNVLKPGDVWGGSDKTNPSYFAPAYYKAFQAYTGDARWQPVTDKAYEILGKAANPNTGLVPNWVKADGTPLDEKQFGYDAMRTTWRIGLDAVWNNDPRAVAFLGKINAFFQKVGVEHIQDKYNLDGSPVGDSCHNAAGVSMAATAAIVDGNDNTRHAFWQQTVTVDPMKPYPQNYYNESMRSLSLLFIGGRMVKP